MLSKEGREGSRERGRIAGGTVGVSDRKEKWQEYQMHFQRKNGERRAEL